MCKCPHRICFTPVRCPVADQPLLKIARSSAAFYLTFFPGFSTLPLTDAAMDFMCARPRTCLGRCPSLARSVLTCSVKCLQWRLAPA